MKSKKLGVLIVDADRENRSHFSMAINKSGRFFTQNCTTRDVALDILKESEPGSIAFIILNANILDTHYLTLAQELTKIENAFNAELVMLTDDIDKDGQFLIAEMGIQSILPTNVDANTVLKTLQDLFSKRKVTMEEQRKIFQFRLAVDQRKIAEADGFYKKDSFKKLLRENFAYYPLLCHYYIMKKQYKECENLLSPIFENPDDYNIDTGLMSILLSCQAKSFLFQNRLDEALLIQEALIKKSPKNLNHQIQLAKINVGKGEWVQALKIAEKILKTDTDNVDGNLISAQSLVGLNRSQEAEVFLEKIAGKCELSSLVSYFNNRGVAFVRKKQFIKALGFYRNALFFSGRHKPEIIFNMALGLFRANRIPESRKMVEVLKKIKGSQHLLKTKKFLKGMFRKNGSQK